MSRPRPRSANVRFVTPYYVEILRRSGLLPQVPAEVCGDGGIDPLRWEWAVYGDDAAIMAIREVPDPFCDDRTQIVVGHMTGSKRGVVALAFEAVRIARERGVELCADISVLNPGLRGLIGHLGGRHVREIWRLAPVGERAQAV